MNQIEFSIKIMASRKRVWETLWNDATFRDWASIVDEETFKKGTLEEGKEVQFLSSSSGYGVTSLVESMVPYEYILFKHGADTKEMGKSERDLEWTGGTESYRLVEEADATWLTVKTDVPLEHVKTFGHRLPLALERIKFLAESV